MAEDSRVEALTLRGYEVNALSTSSRRWATCRPGRVLTQLLEEFYAQLRVCKLRCTGQPMIDHCMHRLALHPDTVELLRATRISTKQRSDPLAANLAMALLCSYTKSRTTARTARIGCG